jgi:hypothetical protein
MGERYKEDPLALAKQMGVDIRGPQSEQFRRRDALDISLNTLRSKGAKALKPKGLSLAEFVKAKGGIQDAGGDVAAMEPPKGVVAETAKQVRDRASQPTLDALPTTGAGMSLADMGRMAAEAGYFPDLLGEVNIGTQGEATDLGARLLAALGDDVAGRKVFAEGEGPDADLQALSDALSERGLDPASMTNDEIAAALDDADGQAFNQDGTLKTDTPEFKAWFGDSNVVDADGKPLVVYHGTRANNEIVQFDQEVADKTGRWTNDSDAGMGFHFTNNEEVAEGYGRVGAYYLSIENPRRISASDVRNSQVEWLKALKAEKDNLDSLFDVDEAQEKRLDEINGTIDYIEAVNAFDMPRSGFYNHGLSLLIEEAKADGKDGVFFIRDDDEFYSESPVEYIAFDPTQIKSVNNRGTFDANDPRILYQVSPEQARAIKMPVEMPTDPIFVEATENTPGARITEDGLLIDLVRFQKPEQGGAESVRTGVFYLPVGSANVKHYKKGGQAGQWYGGPLAVQGQTLIKRPLFVKGATGGKAPEAAYDAINGKGAAAKLNSAARSAALSPKHMREEVVYQFLEEYSADPDMAWQIIENSQLGNQLTYALQENVVAHAVRAAGHDAVIGYSKGKSGPFVSEVFDVRETDYPLQGEAATLHPVFERRELFQSADPFSGNKWKDVTVTVTTEDGKSHEMRAEEVKAIIDKRIDDATSVLRCMNG